MPERKITEGPDIARGRALGAELVNIHAGLRRQLAALLEEAEAGRPPGDLGAQLTEHCLMVCDSLHTHHTNETARGFPRLEERFPDLAPVLDRLRREHDSLAELQRNLAETLADGGEPSRVRDEVRRLVGEMEAHFDREERDLVASLNML